MTSSHLKSGGDVFHAALKQNEHWREATAKSSPELFAHCAAGQQPPILWIGCSDSRVPETTILGSQPGDVFVHRNIANLLHAADLSSQSVIEYAVAHLQVKHIVLCGHSSCGGCKAALANAKLGLIDAWLLPLRQLRQDHAAELAGLASEEARLARLVELNVRQGVQTLRQNHHVIDAMRDRGLKVHGVVYDVGSGRLTELVTDEDPKTGKERVQAFETKA
ncbi:MAG: hypothetical protein M1826_005637 [Phylliscum demangeonii]|nr:MAG: hypothetical protein M1826_005637 [Phylliscum demangeonii]